jgi:Heterokaryon incompatibility protein (HET)
MPSRVIEIQWEDDADQPSLRLLLNAPWEKYAALSYCWGGDQPITATKTALDLLSQFIPFSELPTCLQDAVITAWRLSLRLLWVDSLCVVQDDPGDIAREIAKMPQIYNNAHVTISAARSSSSHDGFLHDLSVPSAQAAIFKIPFHCPDTLFGSIILFQEPGGVHLYNPVDKRAWTLQEHVLSRRVLKYGTHQLSWSCLIEEQYEEDDAGSNWWSRRDQRMSALRNLLRGSVDRTEPKKEEWEKVVADYTSRKLSVPSDRLLAISGIAKVYGDQTKDQYLAGLWLSDLPFSLLWEISSPLQPRPPEYRAPSWSWASVDGHIGRSFDRIPIDPDFRLLSWKMATVESSAPYGGLDFGYIKLQGRVRRALWVDNRNTLIDPDTGDADDGEALAYTSPDINEGFYGNNGHSDRILVWCLQICPYDSVRDLGPLGLIMTTTDGQTFQRLGAFSFDRDVYRKSKESHDFYTFHREKQQRWADGCKLQTIRII